MTRQELFKALLEKHGLLEKYVILRYSEDTGFYIEYAFTPGAPHDPDCLDWYHSWQPEAYARNGWFTGLSESEATEKKEKLLAEKLSMVDHIFELSSCTCGGEENLPEKLKENEKSFHRYHGDHEEFIPENYICKVGCPAPNCQYVSVSWTRKEPVKCACWYLNGPGKTLEEFLDSWTCTLSLKELMTLLNEIQN